jgi:RNA polymerase sigma-70 factor (ECF subfamily)
MRRLKSAAPAVTPQNAFARGLAFWLNDSMIPEPSLSLSDLLSRARAGQPGELDRLFAACRNYLCLLARSHVEGRLKAKADASDIVQQTMFEAYRDFDNFRGGSEKEWLAWLKRILAHNAAEFVRHYRGTGKRQIGREIAIQTGGDTSQLPAVQPADPGESPSQQFLRKERELIVADAIAQLPPDYREVICLRNLQRLSFEEVAEQMDRSRPAVQMLWMRALHRLREVLAALPDQSGFAPLGADPT